jgi:hypothetical protein
MADEKERTAVDDLLDRFVEGLTPNHHKSMASPAIAMEVRGTDLRQSAAALLRGYDSYAQGSAAPRFDDEVKALSLQPGDLIVVTTSDPDRILGALKGMREWARKNKITNPVVFLHPGETMEALSEERAREVLLTIGNAAQPSAGSSVPGDAATSVTSPPTGTKENPHA